MGYNKLKRVGRGAKLYAVSDLHGYLEGLDPSGMDIVLIAGDLAVRYRILPGPGPNGGLGSGGVACCCCCGR